MTPRGEKDLELWKKWQASKSPADLTALLNNMSGSIAKEVSRWQGVLARPVLEMEARRLAVQAFETYNPNSGASLNTHVVNTLQKLSRITYTHQNVARIPEYQTLKINAFTRATRELEDLHGRPPTQEELAGHMGWSKGAVTNFQKMVRSEQVESREHMPMFGSDQSDGLVDLVYHDLTPMQKSIFEHSTGYGGKPVLSNPELLKQLKITQGQLSYEKRKIVDHIDRVQKLGK